MNQTKNQPAQTAAALLLLAAITLFRVVIGFQPAHLPWLENFAPVAAVALCGGIYLPRRLAFAVPLGALFISDLLLNWHFHSPLVSPEMISRYVALGLTVALGVTLRARPRFATVLPASLLGSLIFYLLTNTSSWFASSGYAHTFAGWLQALTTGLPGYEPTWMFFRSTILSDLLFTALFVLCMAATRAPAPAPAAEPAL
jgi:hypothetical protein